MQLERATAEAHAAAPDVRHAAPRLRAGAADARSRRRRRRVVRDARHPASDAPVVVRTRRDAPSEARARRRVAPRVGHHVRSVHRPARAAACGVERREADHGDRRPLQLGEAARRPDRVPVPRPHGREGDRCDARSSCGSIVSFADGGRLFSVDDMVLPAHAYSTAWNRAPTVSGWTIRVRGVDAGSARPDEAQRALLGPTGAARGDRRRLRPGRRDAVPADGARRARRDVLGRGVQPRTPSARARVLAS